MGEDRSDPRPVLAIFALLVTAAMWRAVSGIGVDQLFASAASLAPFALGALAIASALATQRFLATRRTLATRTAVAVVPADEFDAKPEAILRVAAELARADRSRSMSSRRSAPAPSSVATIIRLRLLVPRLSKAAKGSGSASARPTTRMPASPDSDSWPQLLTAASPTGATWTRPYAWRTPWPSRPTNSREESAGAMAGPSPAARPALTCCSSWARSLRHRTTSTWL
jgi:hypothetical protein